MVDKDLVELRARFMDSGRIRRSCTIEKNNDLKKSEKSDVKNKNVKKLLKSPDKSTNTTAKKKVLKIPKDLKKTKRRTVSKKKQTSKKDVNKKQGEISPKKSTNVVYKEATGLTSEEDSEFSSESEGEWDERTTDSQGNKRTGKRQSRIESASESDSNPDPENSSTENETDEEAAGPSGSNAKSIRRKKTTFRKRPAKQNRFGAPKRILMDSGFNPRFEPGRIEQAKMNFSETLGQPMENETSWTEAELSILTDVLDSMRAKAEHLGIYGLSERQVLKIQRQLSTKSVRQIKAAVSSTLLQIKENEEITDPEKHSPAFLWNELFQSVFNYDNEMKVILAKQQDAFQNFFKDKAEEVEFEDMRNREIKLAKEDREELGVPKQAEVDFPEIYRYLATMSSGKKKFLPTLNIASSAILVELLDEIEKETEDVVTTSLQNELNQCYQATLTNRRVVPFLDNKRRVYSARNRQFDEFNPLALNLPSWKERLCANGDNESVHDFSMEFEN
ncbi:unnamed protein product [Oikopleura dioica]|uniref:Uncharacterized protein n=1 Tax=Oikopleura dioica TaxID=34765 RepID=E4YN07_OIKDI|nr:unnamed protein product [Oikopleura dioica]